jgi:hypothetical protein
VTAPDGDRDETALGQVEGTVPIMPGGWVRAPGRPAERAPSAAPRALAVGPEEIEQGIEHEGGPPGGRIHENPGRILMDEPGSGHTSGALVTGAGADRRTD